MWFFLDCNLQFLILTCICFLFNRQCNTRTRAADRLALLYGCPMHLSWPPVLADVTGACWLRIRRWFLPPILERFSRWYPGLWPAVFGWVTALSGWTVCYPNFGEYSPWSVGNLFYYPIRVNQPLKRVNPHNMPWKVTCLLPTFGWIIMRLTCALLPIFSNTCTLWNVPLRWMNTCVTEGMPLVDQWLIAGCAINCSFDLTCGWENWMFPC